MPTERLFLRCQREWVADDGTIKPANIHFPDQSVNREKYSRLCDVLLPDGPDTLKWVYQGVASLAVKDVPKQMTSAGNVVFDFTVEHDPLDDNFGHAELRVYKSGKREKNKGKINSEVKKAYRTEVGLRTRVVFWPLE